MYRVPANHPTHASAWRIWEFWDGREALRSILRWIFVKSKNFNFGDILRSRELEIHQKLFSGALESLQIAPKSILIVLTTMNNFTCVTWNGSFLNLKIDHFLSRPVHDVESSYEALALANESYKCAWIFWTALSQSKIFKTKGYYFWNLRPAHRRRRITLRGYMIYEL